MLLATYNMQHATCNRHTTYNRHTHNIHTYIHTYTHTYTHTPLHTYTHTYTHTHIHTYIHTTGIQHTTGNMQHHFPTFHALNQPHPLIHCKIISAFLDMSSLPTCGVSNAVAVFPILDRSFCLTCYLLRLPNLSWIGIVRHRTNQSLNGKLDADR